MSKAAALSPRFRQTITFTLDSHVPLNAFERRTIELHVAALFKTVHEESSLRDVRVSRVTATSVQKLGESTNV